MIILQIGEEEAAILKTNGISCALYGSISARSGQPVIGYIIASEFLDSACELLNIDTVVPYSTVEPDITFLPSVRVVPNQEPGQRIFQEPEAAEMSPTRTQKPLLSFSGEWPYGLKNLIKPKIEQALKNSGIVHVVVRYAAGVRRDPYVRNDLNITLYSTNSYKDPYSSFVLGSGETFKVCPPCEDEQCIHINDDINNIVIASILGNNNLYIHPDLDFRAGFSRREADRVTRSVFNLVIERFLESRQLSTDERKERCATQSQNNTANNLDGYIRLCSNRNQSEINTLKSSISLRLEQQSEYMKNLSQVTREIPILKDKLAVLQKHTGPIEEKIRREFEKLGENKKIERVEISGDKIIVYTDYLRCKHPRTGNVHEIGKFRITLNALATKHQQILVWENLTGMIVIDGDKAHAPHIQGHACLGNLAQILPPLVANYEFPTIIGYAIKFIESVNINDEWGQDLEEWPIVQEKQQ